MLNLRKKLLVSIFTLMLALVAVSTTTYAWFTLGNSVQVSGIDMSVQGTEGLMMRVHEVNGVELSTIESTNPAAAELRKWKISQDLTTLFAQEDFKTEFVPASLAAQLSDGTSCDPLKLYQLAVSGSSVEYSELSQKPAGQSANYITITFEFYSLKDVDVTLDTLLVTPDKAAHSFTTPVDIIGTDGNVVDEANTSHTIARFANSVRVAYLNSTLYQIINPSVYNQGVTELGTWSATTHTSVKYYNDTSEVDIVSVPAEYSDYVTESTIGNGGSLVKLTAANGAGEDPYYTGKVTLMIWLEGWDADCFNAVIYDKATVDMKFGIKTA